VIWVLAIFLGAFLADGGKRFYRYLFNGAIGFSLLVTWLLLRNPYALYQETTMGATDRAGSLFVILSNLHTYLPNILPSFLKIEPNAWAPNALWIAAVLLFVAAFLLLRDRDIRLSFYGHAAAAALLIVGFFMMYVLYPRPVLVSPRTAALSASESWTFYSLSRVARMGEPGKFAILEDDRDYNFYFTTQKPLDKLEVEFGSPDGDYSLRLVLADAPAFAVTTRREVMTRTIDTPPAYPWKGRSLYRLSIRLDKKSDVRTAVTPYMFVLRPGR
jgi:hypothetical protein